MDSKPPTSLPLHPNLPPQGLPSISALTSGVRPPPHNVSPDLASDGTRDSGYWAQSKHTSATSGLQLRTILNPDDSPQRASVPNTPLSGRIPTSALSTASALPSINQGFNDANNRDSRDSAALSFDSRRSSVDSRMHQSMNTLYIHNPSSPYESANTSQVSLAASLRRPNGQTPMSPLSGRNSLSRATQPRVAPPIIGRVPGAPDPTAAKPTQGYAWAFPDHPIPEERADSESDDDESEVSRSRHNSFAASSVRSSIFSTDSHMPPGQRRLDDEHTTHHHTMQHRVVQGLQAGDAAGQVGNYSRTPELRVSHKLAERKRRSEMKDLFEDLNKAVPSGGGNKASKWEILTKAIEYIRATQTNERQLHGEVSRLQRDSEYAREAHKENEMLKTEVQVMHQHLRRLDPNTPHVYGHFTSQLSQQQTHSGPAAGANGISLPPLQTTANANGPSAFSGFGATAPPGAMQGVEYGYAR